MDINFFFVKNRKNYYSFPPLIAALSCFNNVRYRFITMEEVKNLSLPSETTNVFAFSYNSIAFQKDCESLEHTVKAIKKKGGLTIVGGPHATARPKDFFDLGFDAVVKGDGELAIKNIVERITLGKEISGLYSLPINSLDAFPPFPDDKTCYKPIEISRGCPFACSYCQTTFLFSPKPLHRSIDNILFYIKKAISWGIRDFRFITPNALGYGSFAKGPNISILSELLSKIKTLLNDRGRIFFGSFPSEVRPEFVTKEAILLLKEFVDNRRIIVGAQTFSERLLTLCHRGHTVEDIERAIEIILEAGFSVDVDLIVGFPNEEEQDLEQTLSYIGRYSDDKVKFHLHYFMPLPGTPWEKERPSKLPDFALREFKRLTGKGKVWGAWLMQKSYTKLI